MNETDARSAAGLSPSRIAVLLLLFLVSGAAALIYEVLWLKELGRLFGVTAHAAATTLAVFFLGLSAGGFVWGRTAARTANPLRAYALLEGGIALSALLYFLLLDIYHWLYGPLFGLLGEQPAAFLAVKFLLSAGVLFLPAFFMGGTLPVMAEFLVRHPRELGRMASLLYALNTIGAAAGALLAGFYLPAVLGFRRSYFVAILLNVGIALVTFVWSRNGSPKTNRGEHPSVAAPVTNPDAGIPAILWVVAATSGFITLALEVLWTRMYAQVLQNSVYTFAAILVVFLISLALGSGLANLLCRTTWKPGAVLFGLLTLSGILVGLTPLLFYRVTGGLQVFGAGLGWSAYIARVFVLTATVLLVPGIVIGSVFPFLMKFGEASMRSAGRLVGQLASVNTLAAILGSLVAGFFLLDAIGLWNAIRLMAMSYLALAALLLLRESPVPKKWIAAPALGVLLFASALTYADLVSVHLDASKNERLLHVREGSHGTVVVTDQEGDLRIKVNNSYLLGTSNSAPNLRLQSYLPLSLHADPKTVFYLGLGTGITAGGALDFPVERVTVSELNADVVEAGRGYFGPYVNGLFDDARVAVIPEDGRNYLYGTRQSYDVIIADIFLTYKAGVGSLYTKEHFEAVRARLAPGGVFAQWLTMFDLSEEEFGIITRTMLDVFPQLTLWRRSPSPKFPVYALIAREQETRFDLESFRRNFERLVREEKLPRGFWLEAIPLAAYAGNPGEARQLFDRYVLNTDDRTPLEYLAPVTERNSKGAGERSVLAWIDLARYCEELLTALPPREDPYLAEVDDAAVNQVFAGLAYYEAETHRREGRAAESQAALRRYERLLGTR
jgi:spermidine synthase